MWWSLVAVLLSQSPETPNAEAKRLFLEASQLFETKRYDEAARLFEASFNKRHRPESAFNRARCAEFAGDVAAAVGWYRWYLRLAPGAPDRPDVERLLRGLSQKAAEAGAQVLTVFATPENASLRIDDGAVAVGWLSQQLSPGTHRVTASAEGYTEVRIPLVLALDSARELPLALEPLPPAPDAPTVAPPVAVEVPPLQPTVEPRREPPPVVAALGVQAPAARPLRWTWVGGGLTLASAATASALGVSAITSADRLRNAGVQEPARVNEIASEARGLATGADLAWVVAGTSLAATVVIFFIER
jgi:hypothetical protein